MYSVKGKLWDRNAKIIWWISLISIVGAFVVAGAWGIAFGSGKPLVVCTSGTSSIDQYGNKTTIWYPKGCYHK